MKTQSIITWVVIVVVVLALVFFNLAKKEGEVPVVSPSVSTSVTPIVSTATSTVVVGLGQLVTTGNGITISPKKLIEDSRCPLGVMCIQAGTVRVDVVLISAVANPSTATTTITLGKPVEFGNKTITLTVVEPIKRTQVTVKPEDYRFTFEVK